MMDMTFIAFTFCASIVFFEINSCPATSDGQFVLSRNVGTKHSGGGTATDAQYVMFDWRRYLLLRVSLSEDDVHQRDSKLFEKLRLKLTKVSIHLIRRGTLCLGAYGGSCFRVLHRCVWLGNSNGHSSRASRQGLLM